MNTAQHKSRLQAYFDGDGFERWRAIYGHAPLGGVRRTIREGHAAMLAQAEQWLTEGPEVEGQESGAGGQESGIQPSAFSLLDAGCGTGLFGIALARRGWQVTAVDLAPQMIATAREQARQAGVAERMSFAVGDLEAAEGLYDAVACFDVLIHYPPALFAPMVGRLARLTRGPLLLTYAPREPLLAALHWIGGRFPKANRRTDIQMISDTFVRETLGAAGMQIRRSARVSRGFYHVALVEAARNAK